MFPIDRWFKSLDWEEVYYKQLKPPIVPKVYNHKYNCLLRFFKCVIYNHAGELRGGHEEL